MLGPESRRVRECSSSKLSVSSKVFSRWFLNFEWNDCFIWFLQICETYPRELYVPRIASKPIIVGSSKFRSKGRFPVLSYYHQDKEVGGFPSDFTDVVAPPQAEVSKRTLVLTLRGHYYSVADRGVLAFHLINFRNFNTELP